MSLPYTIEDIVAYRRSHGATLKQAYDAVRKGWRPHRPIDATVTIPLGSELRSLTLLAGTALWITDIEKLLTGAVEFANKHPRRTSVLKDVPRAASYRWTTTRRLMVTPLVVRHPKQLRPIRLLGLEREDILRAGRLAFRLMKEKRRAEGGPRRGLVEDDLIAWWTHRRSVLVRRRWVAPEEVSDRWSG